YEWKFTNLRVGPYLVSSGQTGCSIKVEVPPGGASGIRIEVPDPTDVRVRIIEMGTRRDVEVHRLSWTWARPPMFEAGQSRQATRNETTLTYDFRCPVGTVELSTTALALGF